MKAIFSSDFVVIQTTADSELSQLDELRERAFYTSRQLTLSLRTAKA